MTEITAAARIVETQLCNDPGAHGFQRGGVPVRRDTAAHHEQNAAIARTRAKFAAMTEEQQFAFIREGSSGWPPPKSPPRSASRPP